MFPVLAKADAIRSKDSRTMSILPALFVKFAMRANTNSRKEPMLPLCGSGPQKPLTHTVNVLSSGLRFDKHDRTKNS